MMATVTLTFAYKFPSKFGEKPAMQYSFVNPLTFDVVGPTIAKTFAQVAIGYDYDKLKEFAVELYNASEATIEVDEEMIPLLLEVAAVFKLEKWKYDILSNIINGRASV